MGRELWARARRSRPNTPAALTIPLLAARLLPLQRYFNVIILGPESSPYQGGFRGGSWRAAAAAAGCCRRAACPARVHAPRQQHRRPPFRSTSWPVL